jgi:hypothetical protein
VRHHIVLEEIARIQHRFYSGHRPLVDQCGIILVHTRYKPHVTYVGRIDEVTEPVPAHVTSEGDTEAATAEDFPPPTMVRMLDIPPHNFL